MLGRYRNIPPGKKLDELLNYSLQLEERRYEITRRGMSPRCYELGVFLFDADHWLEAAATLALGAGSQGSIRTETLKAFTEAKYRKIIAKIP